MCSYYAATQAITSPSRQCKTGWGDCCKLSLVNLGKVWSISLGKVWPVNLGTVWSVNLGTVWPVNLGTVWSVKLGTVWSVNLGTVCGCVLVPACNNSVSPDPNCLLVSTWPWKSWSLLLCVLVLLVVSHLVPIWLPHVHLCKLLTTECEIALTRGLLPRLFGDFTTLRHRTCIMHDAQLNTVTKGCRRCLVNEKLLVTCKDWQRSRE